MIATRLVPRLHGRDALATLSHASQEDGHCKPTIHAAASSAGYLLYRAYVIKV